MAMHTRCLKQFECAGVRVYLGYSSGSRPHVLSVNENVHSVIAAPLHTHTVPNLTNNHIQ